MGLRFRKSIKLAPGLRMNFSSRGVGLSAGPRGASFSFGSRGIYANVGIPGTGIGYRAKLLSSTPRRTKPSVAAQGPIKVSISLQDDGGVHWSDDAGRPLPPKVAKAVQAEVGEQIREWLREKCGRWNHNIDKILHLHLVTPPPHERRIRGAESFEAHVPDAPALEERRLRHRLFFPAGRQLEKRNSRLLKEHAAAMETWQTARRRHEQGQAQISRLIESADGGDVDAMRQLLEISLLGIEWPRETIVDFEIDESGRLVNLAVDLPEIEDLPEKQAVVSPRGFRLILTERTSTQRRKEYMVHIHAVAFRLIGEVLAALPHVQEVILSGYSQRLDKRTGVVGNEYLLSVRVHRALWGSIEFRRLEAIDVVAAFERFELRRKMTKTGIFTPVEPIVSAD